MKHTRMHRGSFQSKENLAELKRNNIVHKSVFLSKETGDLQQPPENGQKKPDRDIISTNSGKFLEKSAIAPAENHHHPSNKDTNSQTQEDNIVLMTFMFGQEKASKRSLRLFVESAKTSGVDYIIIGDTQLPLELPPNIRWFEINWDTFVDRAFEKLVNGQETTKLRKSKVKDKEWDFAPTLAFLFPELVEGYSFWGTIDASNMLMGKVLNFVTPQMLKQYDIISGHHSLYACAPFMLYRNTAVVNELFKQHDQTLEKSILNMGYKNFHAEGGMGPIIKKQKLGLRVSRGTMGGKNDVVQGKGQCNGNDPTKNIEWCNECIDNKGDLIKGRTGSDILFCHFHEPDQREQHEGSLKNDTQLQAMLESKTFRYGWIEGFEPLGKSFDSPTDEVKAFYIYHFNSLSNIELTNMLTWGARIVQYGYSCKFFLDRFPYTIIPSDEQSATEILDADPKSLNSTDIFWSDSICHAAKAFHKYRAQEGAKPWPHILLFHFDEGFRGFSSSYPNKTKQGIDLISIWQDLGCSKDFIWESLDHPDTLGAFTNQFQAFYHPKVYSIPLGYQKPETSNTARETLRNPHRWPWFKPKILMINAKDGKSKYPERQRVMDDAIENFGAVGIALKNSYMRTGLGFQRYFLEMKDSRFIMSPSGFGYDCYRHWEGIYLGAIPIIEHANRTDGWYRSLDDLPVAQIESYDELTPEWLDKEYHRLLSKTGTYNYDKITSQWWMEFVYSHLTNELASANPAQYWTQISKKGALSGGFDKAYLDAHPEFSHLRKVPKNQPWFRGVLVDTSDQ